MMNLLALALLLSTLAAAGVWSPHPDPTPSRHDDPVAREGHRLIVVEYERQLPLDGGDHHHHHHHHQGLIEEAKDKFQEAASLLPNLGQGISGPLPPSSKGGGITGKICDAYGVCRDKISEFVGKGKDDISHKAEELKDAVVEGKDDVSHEVSQMKKDVVDVVGKGKEMVSEKTAEAKEAAKDSIGKGKDKISEKASKVKESAKDTIHHAANSAMEAGEEMASNVSAAAGKAIDLAERAAIDLKGNLTDIVRRARDVASDAAAYIGAPETARSVASAARLLGVATAYGACIWVTFVSSHVLAAALPRHQFGIVQSKLYPVYFRIVAYGLGVALASQFVTGCGRPSERVQMCNLMAAASLVLVNMMWLEPKATKVMFERMKMEKEEGRGRDVADVIAEGPVTPSHAEQEAVKSRVLKLNRKLKRLNGYSSLFNVMSLMGMSWHLVHQARCLQQRC